MIRKWLLIAALLWKYMEGQHFCESLSITQFYSQISSINTRVSMVTLHLQELSKGIMRLQHQPEADVTAYHLQGDSMLPSSMEVGEKPTR